MQHLNLTPSPYAPFMQTGIVTVGELDFCFEVGGKPDAPTILLIMGLGAQLLHWPDYFCKSLIDHGFRVIRFDNRDIGLSSRLKQHTKKGNMLKAMIRSTLGLRNKAPYNLYDMAKDTVGLMDALGVSKAHVIGASMGGMIAQIIAAKYPEKIDTLSILFSSNLKAFSQPPYPKQLKLLMSGPKAITEEAVVRFGMYFLRTIGTPEHMEEEALKQHVTKVFRRSYRPDGVMRQFQAVLATGSLRKIDKLIKHPTLVVHGSHDRFLPPSNGRNIRRAIKSAKFELVHGMGHDIPEYFTPKLANLFINHINANAYRA